MHFLRKKKLLTLREWFKGYHCESDTIWKVTLNHGFSFFNVIFVYIYEQGKAFTLGHLMSSSPYRIENMNLALH